MCASTSDNPSNTLLRIQFEVKCCTSIQELALKTRPPEQVASLRTRIAFRFHLLRPSGFLGRAGLRDFRIPPLRIGTS